MTLCNLATIHFTYFFALTGLSLVSSINIQAAEFHVKTGIFFGNEAKAIENHITSFQDNVVYDLTQGDYDQVTVMDFNTNLIHLIDTRDKTQVLIKQPQILEFSAKLTTNLKELISQGGNQVSEIIKFHQNPNFTQEIQLENLEAKFSGSPVAYKINLRPTEDNRVIEDYYRFCNWSAYLNYVTVPGGNPPNARFEINETLKNKGMLPHQIEKTIKNTNPAENLKLKSKHEFVWRSSQEDINRLEKIKKSMKEYRAIPLSVYLNKQKNLR